MTGGQYKLRALGPELEIEIDMKPLIKAMMQERTANAEDLLHKVKIQVLAHASGTDVYF